MNITEFFKKTYPINKFGIGRKFHIRPRIICKDGFAFSVQANEGAYCSPRQMIESGYYSSAEIGYPSEEEPLINEYADESAYVKTIYGYVPIDLIDEVLIKHGGIDESKTFPYEEFPYEFICKDCGGDFASKDPKSNCAQCSSPNVKRIN